MSCACRPWRRAAPLPGSPSRKSRPRQPARSAVVGKVFWSGSVAAMGAVQEAAVREGLHELARKELVRPARRSSVENQAEYSFWHVLVQEVAYGQIARPLRSQKHRAAARWIEGLAGDRIADHAEVLAYHYGEALALARASGSTGGIAELEETAAKFLVLAGDRAANLDLVKAESFYRREEVHVLGHNVLAVAISLFLIGFFMMINRRKALTQVLALLSLENGLFLAAISLTYGMPLVVEMGVLFDVLVAVMVLGILVYRIKESFESMDVSRLRRLRG